MDSIRDKVRVSLIPQMEAPQRTLGPDPGVHFFIHLLTNIVTERRIQNMGINYSVYAPSKEECPHGHVCVFC